MNGHAESSAEPPSLKPWGRLLGPHVQDSWPNHTIDTLLQQRNDVSALLINNPYCLPLYLLLSRTYEELEYPELAVGESYKALLLRDAVLDESDEYHDVATEAMEELSPFLPDDERLGDEVEDLMEFFYGVAIYKSLARCLIACGCYQSAFSYCQQELKAHPHNQAMSNLRDRVYEAVAKHYKISVEALKTSDEHPPTSWPDERLVRREIYPWNTHEPNRILELDQINAMMSTVAPNLEVRPIMLPVLAHAPTPSVPQPISIQLGIFAKTHLPPNSTILSETSLLTANNILDAPLCDACSSDLPKLGHPHFEKTSACSDCTAVFCSQSCHDRAMTIYHPAMCDRGIDSIGKDVPPAESANSLYTLLLIRALAMSHTQEIHPLDLQEIKYICGDFHPVRSPLKTLPFSFNHSLRLPLLALEKMDINIYTSPQFSPWVLNTLLAKFRATASARLSGLGGPPRGPEVSAVHPMWCLANHSCDPNVKWEWGGSVEFEVRDKRSEWKRKVGEGEEKKEARNGGIAKDEEVLNHYCDIELGVKDRREWANGALGGVCRCVRCLWESGKEQE